MKTYKYGKEELQKIHKKMDSKSKKLIDDFLISETNSGELTKEKKRNGLIKWFDMLGVPLYKKPTIQQIEKTINSMKLTGKDNTLNKDFQYVKKFLLWKWEDEKLVKKLYHPARINEERLNEDALFTNEEREKILRGEEFLRWKVIWSIFDEAGLRSSELVNLKIKDCKFEDNGITTLSIFSRKTKGYRKFPLKTSTKLIKDWLQQYPFPDYNNDDLLFPSVYGKDNSMKIQTINMALKRVARKVGIKKNVFPYLWRHTRASYLYIKSPLGTKTVEKLMGHKNMYQRYAHLSKETAVKEMVDKVLKVEELPPKLKHKLEERIEKLERFLKHLTSDEWDDWQPLDSEINKLLTPNKNENKNS